MSPPPAPRSTQSSPATKDEEDVLLAAEALVTMKREEGEKLRAAEALTQLGEESDAIQEEKEALGAAETLIGMRQAHNTVNMSKSLFTTNHTNAALAENLDLPPLPPSTPSQPQGKEETPIESDDSDQPLFSGTNLGIAALARTLERVEMYCDNSKPSLFNTVPAPYTTNHLVTSSGTTFLRCTRTGTYLSVHKALLWIHSLPFYAYTANHPVKARLVEIDAEEWTIRVFIHWIYARELLPNLKDNVLKELDKVAGQFGTKGLKVAIAKKLKVSQANAREGK
ncbi:hypothetical protein EJ04DRAFT_565496 [Polyplosphaeria fusca]|uniref:BTB domain-containing protein n=1 Tax=Polyplosphaeria fusca TaxID=682080 RepID=A0A9P4QSG0_9PLEO|nr:hypothetical protein EJ04DRAFT_565496 [Polyplosphaeria fusca]